MIPALLFWRSAMIVWVTLSLMPIETVFDAVESELDRRGALPNPASW